MTPATLNPTRGVVAGRSYWPPSPHSTRLRLLPKFSGGVIACSLVLCLGACDGDDETAPQPLTKADVIARVDEICSRGQGQIEGLEPPKNLAASAEFLGRVLPVVQENLDRIRGVGRVPAEDRKTYLEWLQAREGIVQTTRQMIEAAEARDQVEFERLAAEQAELDSRADKAARDYGFEVCGQTS